MPPQKRNSDKITHNGTDAPQISEAKKPCKKLVLSPLAATTFKPISEGHYDALNRPGTPIPSAYTGRNFPDSHTSSAILASHSLPTRYQGSKMNPTSPDPVEELAKEFNSFKR
jgi:hypothetical protein